MSTAFRVVLTGDQEVTVPPGGTGSEASGLGTVIFDDSDPLAPTASYSIAVEGVDFGPALGDKPQTPKIDDDVSRTHFHNAAPGINGAIVFGQIDLVAPANEDDTDDLSVVLNKDHSWTISGVLGTIGPGRQFNQQLRWRSRFGHRRNNGAALLQCPYERIHWGRDPGSAGRHRR